MSKVIHLSDHAHNNAKNFCKQNGLKMSDWVADLIADAIINNRVDPRTTPQAPPPPVVAAHVSSPAAIVAGPSKKRLERVEDRAAHVDDLPPWAAPPFWAGKQDNNK